MPEHAPRPGATTPSAQDALLADMLERALDAGEESVERGPELLPVLREAGVVDAGGYGLTVDVRGRRGRAARRRAAGARAPRARRASPTPSTQSSTYRYCTNFAVTGEELDAARRGSRCWRRIGDSVLVVGDAHTLKVHVHTDEPERATALFAGAGAVSRLDVADMHEQVARARRSGSADGRRPALRRARRRRPATGMAELFELARRHAARRRADAEPLDLRAAGRHPRRAGRGGRGAAELAERVHGRRARRRAVGQDACASCRRARSRRGWPPPSRSTRPRRGGQRRGDGGGARPRPHRRGRPRPRATTASGRFRARRGGRLRRRGARGLGRARRRRCEAVLDALGRDAELVT